MSAQDEYSQEKLSAFVDNELDNNERARLLTAAQQDRALSEEIETLHQYNDLIKLAYHDVTSGNKPEQLPDPSFARYSRVTVAASMLLVLGIIIGWQLTAISSKHSNPIQSLSQLDPDHFSQNKILIHINAMDRDRIDRALDKTESLLAHAKQHGNPLQLEIVVNASGINMLRTGSPYTQRIRSITRQYDNVSFMACGFAMENMRMKEGSEIKLLPEANKVDAALEEILRRLKSGWLYLRS